MSLEPRPFLVDATQEGPRSTSYGTLFGLVRAADSYIPALASSDLLAVCRNLLAGILAERDVTLLDAGLRAQEREALVGRAETEPQPLPGPKPGIQSGDDLVARLRSSPSRLTLFSSGTTGPPKRITHPFARLFASAKLDPRYRDDVWAMAYDPAHMAGLQVLIQALSNLSAIVDVFGRGKAEVVKLLTLHGVTHVSATPTFYRLLLPADFEVSSVRRATLGGEASGAELHARIKRMFPNARIANIYASTEAGALFRADGAEFTPLEQLKDRVQVRDGELWLHASLVGSGAPLQGDWYRTGDLVEVFSTTPLRLRFVARSDELINSGGFKVTPSEVEAAIREHPDVLNARVYGKPSSVLGTVVAAEVQKRAGSALGEKELRAFLAERLRPFEAPRLVVFVEALKTTRSGKLSKA